MDWQSLINLAIGSAFSIAGWFARSMFAAVSSLKDDLSRLREEIARDLVRKDDFRDELREIKAGLERIYDKLDGKEDRK